MEWLPYTKKHVQSISPLLRKIYLASIIPPPILLLIGMILYVTGGEIIPHLEGILFILLFAWQLYILPFLILLYALRKQKWIDSSLFSLGVLVIVGSTVLYAFAIIECKMEMASDDLEECDSVFPQILILFMLFGLIQIALGYKGYETKKKLLIATFISSIPAILFWGLAVLTGFKL